MGIGFTILAALTLVSAIAAMSLRNLVHCALCLIVTFAGLAALFLNLDAEFVGFAQILVYIGAVAILILFAILLTRSSDLLSREARTVSAAVLIGVELMLNAANLNFVAFWHYGPHPEHLTGMMFVLFSIAIAAAEAAVGLALIIAIYRHYKTSNVDQIDSMKG